MKPLQKTLTLAANAKINLSLFVLGRLTTGYHLLSSLICPISLRDEVTVELGIASREIHVELGDELRRHVQALKKVDESVSQILLELNSPSNIAFRAATAFLAAVEENEIGFRISIKKNIPFAAGLGGGSTDAAATLLALNQLCENPLAPSQLRPLAATLGSDVPALLRNQLSLMSGAGELIIPIRGKAEIFTKHTNLLLLKPTLSVSTALAYEMLAFPKDIEPENACDFVWEKLKKDARFEALGLQLNGSAKGDKWLTLLPQEGIRLTLDSGFDDIIRAQFVNDFQESIMKGFSQVAEAFRMLREHAAFHVLLCGSGSSLVGFFNGPEARDGALKQLKQNAPAGWWAAAADLVPEAAPA